MYNFLCTHDTRDVTDSSARRRPSCSTRECTKRRLLFFFLQSRKHAPVSVSAGTTEEGEGTGYRSAFGITFTHNFETNDFIEFSTRLLLSRRPRLKRLHPISDRRNGAPFLSLSLSLFLSGRFRPFAGIIGGRATVKNHQLKLCAREWRWKWTRVASKLVSSHCTPCKHFAESHDFPVFRLCNRSNQFWGRSPNRSFHGRRPTSGLSVS